MKEIFCTSDCTGCMACVNVCAHHAISVVQDKEGFDRPQIDESLCVDCGLCAKTCPINHHPLANEPKEIYSGWSSNEAVRINSSSGGAFTEIARPVLEDGGVVFGCTLNDKLQAEHIYVETLEDLENNLRGSKYVQSRIGNTYEQAKNFLRQGRKVLFSGTPCQIAGLRKYLRKDYENLLTVDLICHGVPSPKLLADFIEANSAKAAVTDIKFRDKKRNGWSAAGSISFNKEDKNKTKLMAPYNSAYYNLYFSNSISRPCCYTCRYANINRVGDITIGDYWNIDAVLPAFDSSGGVSVVLVNTQKGAALTKTLKQGSTLVETSLKSAVDGNGNLSVPSKKSGCRDRIFDDIENNGIAAAAKKYCKFKRVKPFIMRHIPKSLKKRVKVKLKKILGR